jgi:hypothetical protein
MKKSIFFKSSLAAVVALLMASCSIEDNPNPNPIIVLEDVDVTSLVSTTGWGQAGFAGTWAAPEVKTADGRTSQMAEKYHTDVNATGIEMQQTLEGLTNGTYIVEVYANSLYTPNRGFDSDMQDGATDVAYVFANEKQAPIVAKVAETTAENGLYTIEVEVKEGKLTIGLGKNKAGTNWHTIQIKSLTLKDQPVVETDPKEEEPGDVEKTDFTELVAIDGWGQGGFAGWAAPEIVTADGRTAAMAEVYVGNAEGADVTGIIMQQTINGLANGKYVVELYANSFYTPDRFDYATPIEDGATDATYVFANTDKTFIIAKVATSTSENGLYTIETTVSDGTLTLGLAKEKPGTNWQTLQIKSLTLKK